MQKLLVVAAVAALSLVSVGADGKGGKPKLTKEQREQLLMEKVGGFVEFKSSGSIVIVNAQKGYDLAGVKEAIDLNAKNLKIDIVCKDGTFDVAGAAGTVRSLGGNAGVFVIDDPAMPMSLTCHEAPWGMVNIAPLKSDAAKLDKRVAKELNRVLAYMFGAGNSTQKTSVMRSVAKPEDLDKIVNTWLPFDTTMAVGNALGSYGMVRASRITYLMACQEGRAPAPTNEYQKVIWEKCKAEANAKPSNPIKIVKPAK